MKTEEQWKEELGPERYRILREKGTEAPGTGELYHVTDKGMYTCGACGLELFSSDTKYDSGSGWPSFWEATHSENVVLTSDESHGMVRTEVTCARCGSHLGHVFDDGPQDKTGKRFCINSASLDLRKE